MVKFEELKNWRKTNYGIKKKKQTCFFSVTLCQVSVQSKILQSCEPLKREVYNIYNRSVDKPLSAAGQIGVSTILLNKKLVITALDRREEYRGNEGFSSVDISGIIYAENFPSSVEP